MNKLVLIIGIILLFIATHFSYYKKNITNKGLLHSGTVAHESEQYNTANLFWEYLIESDCPGLYCSTGRYNKGNSLYELGLEKSGSEQQDLWKNAVASYEKALEYENKKSYREKIEHNKKFVEDLLSSDEEQQQEDEEQQQEDGDQQQEDGDQQQGNEDQQQGNEEQQQEDGDQQQGNEEQQQEDGEQQQGNEEQQQEDGEQQGEDGEQQGEQGTSSGGEETEQQLSETQKEQLKQYQEILKQQQEDNQQFFSPIPSSMQQQEQSIIDMFFGGNRQLQQQLPHSSGKDW